MWAKMGRPPKLTPHQQREATKRRDRGEESLTEIGRSYNVSAATISVGEMTKIRALLETKMWPFRSHLSRH